MGAMKSGNLWRDRRRETWTNSNEKRQDLKAKVMKLVEEIEPRAARRERLRGVVSPKKLQEFDAVSHRIKAAIRELKEAVRKHPRWPVN